MNKLQFFIHNDWDALRIELAGSLSGACVESVLHAWQKEISSNPGRPRVADISYITDADKHGRALLAMWHRSGARIIARSPQSWALANPIMSEPVEPTTPKLAWLCRLIEPPSANRRGPVRIAAPAEMTGQASTHRTFRAAEFIELRDRDTLETLER